MRAIPKTFGQMQQAYDNQVPPDYWDEDEECADDCECEVCGEARKEAE